jgi:hypothetical protein
MHRYFLIAAALLFSASACAGSPDAPASPSMQVASLAPAPLKVYPPLPTLAMLPPASSDDSDDAPASRSAMKKGKKVRRVVDCKCNGPEPRLVVSDDSRIYLKDVEARLDAALAR